jgi:hypothetical protein
MAMNEREDPTRFGSIAFWVLERGRKQMEVPSEAVGERPRSQIGLVARCGIALKRGRDVISVAKRK